MAAATLAFAGVHLAAADKAAALGDTDCFGRGSGVVACDMSAARQVEGTQPQARQDRTGTGPAVFQARRARVRRLLRHGGAQRARPAAPPGLHGDRQGGATRRAQEGDAQRLLKEGRGGAGDAAAAAAAAEAAAEMAAEMVEPVAAAAEAAVDAVVEAVTGDAPAQM